MEVGEGVGRGGGDRWLGRDGLGGGKVMTRVVMLVSLFMTFYTHQTEFCDTYDCALQDETWMLDNMTST